MNINDYIASGILEAYALGEVTPEQRAELERLFIEYPALHEELARVEETMEAFAMKAAVTPRSSVKERLMKEVAAGEAPTKSKVSTPNFNPWKFAAAASITVALVASYLAYTYHGRWQNTATEMDNLIAQNQQIAQDYSRVNQKLDKVQSDFSIIENTSFSKVVMAGTANAPEALATVYWNASTEEVFLSVQELQQLATTNQFQLWAIVDGKPVDAGVFDLGVEGLLKMKTISGAAAFAVTIEPRGGKASPTMETMQVMGAVVKS